MKKLEPIQRWYAVLVGGVLLSVAYLGAFWVLGVTVGCRSMDESGPCAIGGFNIRPYVPDPWLAIFVLCACFLAIFVTLLFDRPAKGSRR